jgi:hypothetical protein
MSAIYNPLLGFSHHVMIKLSTSYAIWYSAPSESHQAIKQKKTIFQGEAELKQGHSELSVICT